MATQAAGAATAASAASMSSKYATNTPFNRKKDGGPCIEYWESAEILTRLESVRGWIGKHYKKVKCQSVLARC